jgi:hypothetical protein
LIDQSALIWGSEFWTALFYCFHFSSNPLTIRWPSSANPVGCLFCHDFHESGTAWYISNLAVSPTWWLFGFADFLIVTGEDFLIGVPVTCPFSYVK